MYPCRNQETRLVVTKVSLLAKASTVISRAGDIDIETIRVVKYLTTGVEVPSPPNVNGTLTRTGDCDSHVANNRAGDLDVVVVLS